MNNNESQVESVTQRLNVDEGLNFSKELVKFPLSHLRRNLYEFLLLVCVFERKKLCLNQRIGIT